MIKVLKEFWWVLAILLMVAAFNGSATKEISIVPEEMALEAFPSPTPIPTLSPKESMTATAAPTVTQEPTATSEPTVTPEPTETPEPTVSGSRTHIVKAGEWLYKIADMYPGVSAAQIAQASGISLNSTLYVGQTLKIPGGE